MTQLRLDMPDYHTYYKPPDEVLPKVDWKPPSASDVPSWADASRVSIDIECRDSDLKRMGPGVRRPGNYVVGVGFAVEDGPEFYLPMRHEGGDNCDWDVWGYLREQFKSYRGVIVGNGLGYDLDWLAEMGCSVLDKRIMDIQVAEVLINELYFRYDLDAICGRRELPGKDESILAEAAGAYRIDKKKELWKLPARFVARYGMIDARRPLQALRRQERDIQSEGVEQIWELEQKVTPILVKMRRRGVRVDMDHLEMIEQKAIHEAQFCLDELHGMTGVRVAISDLMKPAALAPAIKSQGYRLPITPKTQKESVDKEFLEKCGKVGRIILRAREWNNLRTTFCDQVRRFQINGRVHCTFNQLRSTDDQGEGKGVRFGRFSSTNFNLQQQPIRHDEFGKMWRAVFIPDEGAQWACSDWSQQEPRIGVHYAELLGLPGAREFANEYRRNPDLDIHQKLADLSKMERKIVKNFVNGRLYGMGDTKLCKKINKPTMMKVVMGQRREVPGPEGQAIIDEFEQFAPWLTGLTRAASRQAKRNGHVWTILRRKCRFDRASNGEYQFTHKAFNRVGQGSAADQMKATLIEADKEGIPVQMAVHDEFDFSFYDIKQAQRLKELQLNVIKFNVPMKVDLEIGPNWGELKKVK